MNVLYRHKTGGCMKKLRFQWIKYYDVLAVAFCIAVFMFFFIRIRYGVNRVDESFYLAIAQRFAKGDRPLVDEWQLSQLSHLFLIPFYWAFTAITGGITGIILFMRQMFLAFNLVFYWILYMKLRGYGIWGFFATAVFSCYVPWAMFTLNYYSVSPRLLLLLCLLLFWRKGELGKGRLLIGGAIFSVIVLIEPPFAVLYVLFSASVFILAFLQKRKLCKKTAYAFFLNYKTWLYITLAILGCAFIFLSFLGWKSGFNNIIASIPELLADSEYDFSTGGNVKSFLISKFSTVADYFGGVNLALSVLLCVITFWSTKKQKKTNGKLWIFLLSNLLVLSFCLFPIYSQLRYKTNIFEHWYYYVLTPVPLCSFGFINYCLCEKKDSKLFMIWILSVVSSTLMDSFSDVCFGACLSIAAVPGFLCFGTIVNEFFEQEKLQRNKKSRKAYALKTLKAKRILLIASLTAFAVFIGWEGVNIYAEGTFLLTEGETVAENNMVKIEQGVYEGIYTTSTIAKEYNDLLEDLDVIKAESRGPVYLENPFPLAELYLELPSSNCSSWNSVGTRDRQIRYFQMHPEKTPDVIYYVKRDFFFRQTATEKEMQLFETYAKHLCDGTIKRGKNGIIVNVEKWKNPGDPALMNWVLEHKNEF